MGWQRSLGKKCSQRRPQASKAVGSKKGPPIIESLPHFRCGGGTGPVTLPIKKLVFPARTNLRAQQFIAPAPNFRQRNRGREKSPKKIISPMAGPAPSKRSGAKDPGFRKKRFLFGFSARGKNGKGLPFFLRFPFQTTGGDDWARPRYSSNLARNNFHLRRNSRRISWADDSDRRPPRQRTGPVFWIL